MLRMARTASRCTCGFVVVEQLGQLRQRLAAAELAQQIDGRPADGRIRRTLQSLDRPLADRAEADQDRRQPLARPRTLFCGERLRQRLDHHFAERQAHRLHLFELRLAHARQVRGDVAHHRAGDEHVDGGHGMLATARWIPRSSRLASQHLDELRRGAEVADEQQILNQSRRPASSFRPTGSSSVSTRRMSSTSARSSARSDVVATVDSQAPIRSGGSSPVCST